MLATTKRLLLLCLVTACSSKATPGETPGPTPVTAEAASASRVVTERFHSDALGVDKAVVVYLPRGYDAQPGRRWPVFYYLHGLGGNETNWTQSGKLDAAADALALAAIVVMPDGDDGFYIDSPSKIDFDACMKDGSGLFMPARQAPDATCVHARNYETYIAKDLVGWTDAHYRTIARRDGRAIAGLSMGGFGAMSIGLRHPDEFAAAASHSGAIGLLYRGPRPFAAGKAELFSDVDAWAKAAGPIGAWIGLLLGNDVARWKAHDVVELAGQLPAGKVALYLDCGTEDDFNLQDNVQYVHEALTARHVEHEYFLGPGKHNFEFWAARVPRSLAFLRDHTAKPQ
jgi:S-formylglutathione hydrolase FrmB